MKRYRLSESKLRDIIREAVANVLTVGDDEWGCKMVEKYKDKIINFIYDTVGNHDFEEEGFQEWDDLTYEVDDCLTFICSCDFEVKFKRGMKSSNPLESPDDPDEYYVDDIYSMGVNLVEYDNEEEYLCTSDDFYVEID